MKNNIFIEYTDSVKSTVLNKEYPKYINAFKKHKRIILIGNGGSNSIASHISQDMTKFFKKKAFSFSDPSMLTCFINDFGMNNAYTQFLKYYTDKNTLVILISSSGQSKNIINCVNYLEKNKFPYGVLTGFNNLNTVRTISKNALFNFHVKSKKYGIVECVHQIFLHGPI